MPAGVRGLIGYDLDRLQQGLAPENKAKPRNDIGAGTMQLSIDQGDGWWRVFYVAKFAEAIYVLHGFQKQSNQTPKADVDLAKKRYAELVKERGKK